MQKIICCISQNNTRFTGSFENEDPNLESELSTQNSETEHPRLENEAPKTRKWSTQISKPLWVEGLQLKCLAWRKPNQVEARMRDIMRPHLQRSTNPFHGFILSPRTV